MTFEDFVREHKDWNHNWENISKNSKLTEDFMKEFKDKLNWNKISQYQTLSEDFIKEMKDYVKWSKIARYQTLSEEFKKEYKNKLRVRKSKKTEKKVKNDYWYY